MENQMQDKPSGPRPKLHYYDDSGKINPAFEIAVFKAVVHKLFCRWVRLNYHLRDFPVALHHEAATLYADWLLADQPGFPAHAGLLDEAALLAACPPVPPPAKEESSAAPPHRLYTDEGHLNPAVDTAGFRSVLAPFFVHGVRANWVAREFTSLVQDMGESTVYDHSIKASMGGLGGCPTAAEFIAAFD